MKLLFVLCLIAVVGLSVGEIDLHPRGCIYIEGRCVRDCEEGTHGYSTGCSPVEPEPTCDNPTPVVDPTEDICDFTACYCDAPTVRDTATGKCVLLEECTKTKDTKN
ncbi:uncharacterized protein LOC120633925 [Pararge aegeria]|uniref:Jg17250 protein n=1 Tax=Pararge aegeria aegeria TaxID=348720 RepID=A0A8S4RK75_9NEOP|nr:uncharacterized protein LOC120633925 [Pararge aegeria]CAH2237074.1 jg17250 [Pararge aegeria aegeria]